MRPSGSFPTDANPTVSTVVISLESEKRMLEGRFLDLEFQADELQVENDLLRTQISQLRQQHQKPAGESISSLQPLLTSATSRSHLAKIESEYSSYLLSERRADLAFLEVESRFVDLTLSEDSEQSDLNTEIASKLAELDACLDRLRAVEEEEQDEASAYSARERELPTEHLRRVPDDWESSRASTIGKHRKLQSTLAKELAIQKAAQERLHQFEGNLFVDLGIDETDVRKALTAQIEIQASQVLSNLKAAMESEVMLKGELERELGEVQATAAFIQGHHEGVIERQKRQYEMAANRARLQDLQGRLEAIADV